MLDQGLALSEFSISSILCNNFPGRKPCGKLIFIFCFFFFFLLLLLFINGAFQTSVYPLTLSPFPQAAHLLTRFRDHWRWSLLFLSHRQESGSFICKATRSDKWNFPKQNFIGSRLFNKLSWLPWWNWTLGCESALFVSDFNKRSGELKFPFWRPKKEKNENKQTNRQLDKQKSAWAKKQTRKAKKTKIRSDQSKKARNKSERRKEFRLRADYLHDAVFT